MYIRGTIQYTMLGVLRRTIAHIALDDDDKVWEQLGYTT